MYRDDENRGALVERLDYLSRTLASEIAQTYVANGDPEEAPVDLTFAEFVAEVRRRANALAAIGVSAGDVVAFAAPPSQHSYATMIGAMATTTLAPINYFLETPALVRLLRASGAKWLLVHKSFDDAPSARGKFEDARGELSGIRVITFGSGVADANALDLEAVASGEDGAVWKAPARSPSMDRIVALFHTGGTTGLPKLVPHTEAMHDASLTFTGRAQGNRPGETMMSGLPLFHTSGAINTGMAPLFNGARIVIPSSRGFRDPKVVPNYWRFVARHKITLGAAVPTILAALAANRPDCNVSSLRYMLVGGAPSPRATIETIGRFTGGAEVIEGWGMTETCGFSIMNPHGGTKLGSVGRPFDCVEAQIRKVGQEGPASVRCATDEIGELVVRGDVVIRRYLDERPASFTDDGWLRTGDMGRVDSDGYFWITGRLKDIIIRSGHNIDPAVIEEPACRHPAVQLAAAVGRPDKYAGELPVLFVQLKQGAVADPAEIEAYVRERVVERAAAPKSVRVLAALPLSGAGKVLKSQLRSEAIREVFQQEIDDLGLPSAVIATPTDDERLGVVVELSDEAAAPNQTARAKVAAALDGYAVAYQWKHDQGIP